MHQVFDPMEVTKLSREAQRNDPDRVERIWQAQVAHRKRLIDKPGNKEAPEKPPYMDVFRYRDYSHSKELCRLILESKGNLKKMIKEELATIKEMLEFKEYTEKRRGGPPTKKFMDRYPGDEVIKDLLRTKYGFEFAEPRKII